MSTSRQSSCEPKRQRRTAWAGEAEYAQGQWGSLKCVTTMGEEGIDRMVAHAMAGRLEHNLQQLLALGTTYRQGFAQWTANRRGTQSNQPTRRNIHGNGATERTQAALVPDRRRRDQLARDGRRQDQAHPERPRAPRAAAPAQGPRCGSQPQARVRRDVGEGHEVGAGQARRPAPPRELAAFAAAGAQLT